MQLLNLKLSITVSEDPAESAEDKEKKEDEHFKKVYRQWKGINEKDKDDTYKVIPKFYFKVSPMDNLI